MNIYYPLTSEQYGPVISGPGASRNIKPFCLKRLNVRQEKAIERAKEYASEQNIRTNLLRQTRQHEEQQMINLRRTQAMALLSRLYVGSINYDIREDTVKAAFSCFGPVKSVSMTYDPLTQRHMGYAFLEFEYPEAAQVALTQVTGIVIGGRQAKVGRPSNMPQNSPLIDELYAAATKYSRVYVSNVHSNLTSDDLKMVFEAFGEIELCMLQPDLLRPGKHRGFGFIEYKTQQAATEAIGAMDRFDLGGQLLRVTKAITPANLVNPGITVAATQMPVAAALAAASITAQVQALEVQQIVVKTDVEPVTLKNAGKKDKPNKFSAAKVVQDSASSPVVVIPDIPSVPVQQMRSQAVSSIGSSSKDNHVPMEKENKYHDGDDEDEKSGKSESLDTDNVKIRGRDARNQMMQKLMRSTVQRVMVLKNMIDHSEIDDTIDEEVSEECCKFGEVQEVKIVVESSSSDGENCGEVKIFVVFKSPESLDDAIRSMNGRYFGGRIVVAEKYDQFLFDQKDYTA